VRLADAYAAGRLSPAEHDSRLSQALTAVTEADLAELLDDLPVPLRSPDVARHRSREPVLVSAAWVALFQFVLMLAAFCVGVDLERESRSALSIFLAVWGTGTLSAVTGQLIARRHQPRRPDDAVSS